MFLRLNGYNLNCTGEELLTVGLDVATGHMNEQQLAAWVEAHVTESDPL